MSQTRRRFINFAIAGGVIGWLGSLLYPVFRFLTPPSIPEANLNSVRWGPVEDFPIDSSQIVRFGRKPVILIRSAEDNFHAFAATCTHLDCIVQYRGEQKDIWCACHNGVYDMRGRNVSGPPPAPLETFDVSIVEGDILISRQTA
jgi:Rieske Fe-S protein